MGKIRLLEPKLQNLIAAGEVIERLANVVKELIENSLDAGARHIDISLEDSGFKTIVVQDDGSGMDETDAIMAFSRHATSKISTEYDLFHIGTLGFRGEALPSIASVAKVELSTSADGKEGFGVVIQDGKTIEKKTLPPIQGTRIKVTRLFYHTPARFKYLKAPQTELANIIDVVNRLAIANLDVAFSLTNNDRPILRTPGNGKIVDVMAAIYGIEASRTLKDFHNRNRDYVIDGDYASPVHNRASRNAVQISVNERPIRDNRLVNTVLEAFGQLVPIHRYPLVVLRITVDPQLVDVNVHPTKNEVRFSEFESLKNLVFTTLRESLENMPVIHDLEKSADSDYRQDPFVLKDIVEEKTLFDYGNPEEVAVADGDRTGFPDFDYIGQYRGTYLLFQNDIGLFLVDQHAAAERIRYERYYDHMGKETNGAYELMVPMQLEISSDVFSQITNGIMDTLANMQIGIRMTESGSYEITSVPEWFPRYEEAIYVETVIMRLLEHKETSKAILRDDLAKLLSCKHSLKANAYLSSSEVEELIKGLKKCRNPYTCPHGRPIIVLVHNHDIEKWFKRIQ